MKDEPVFVVDLREPSAPGPTAARDIPLAAGTRVARVAVVDLDGELVQLPIAPTEDRRWLDAVARLLRFAVDRGERLERVVAKYGSDYEKGLARDGELPAWFRAPPMSIGRRGSGALRRALGLGRGPRISPPPGS